MPYIPITLYIYIPLHWSIYIHVVLHSKNVCFPRCFSRKRNTKRLGICFVALWQTDSFCLRLHALHRVEHLGKSNVKPKTGWFHTPRKINMEPENMPLEKENNLPNFQTIIFRFYVYVNLRGVYILFHRMMLLLSVETSAQGAMNLFHRSCVYFFFKQIWSILKQTFAFSMHLE